MREEFACVILIYGFQLLTLRFVVLHFFFKRDINVIILIILLAPSGLECGGPTFESLNEKRLGINPTTPILDRLVPSWN